MSLADPRNRAAIDAAIRRFPADPAEPPVASAPSDMASPTTTPAPTSEDEAVRFREAMSRLASGIVLVTASLDGRPWGMTVSAACPVCTTPPTMLVSLSTHTALAQAIAQTGRFGVSVLGDAALHVARFGAAAGTPKFLDEGLDVDCAGGHPAAAMVDGALAHVDCDVVRTVLHGTHALHLGRVRATTIGAGGGPLVHYDRGFWQIGEAA
jgi:flavin reductase (DIM6/NTAB) family NADH-FMN oxidoreductase RutF